MMRLDNKVAIVTGAGRGIGRAIALAYGKKGACLSLVSRTETEIRETADLIASEGSCPVTIKADISKPDEVDLLVDRTIEAFGTVDILVNNAGIQGPIGKLEDNDIEQWIHTIQVNLIGPFLCARRVLPILKEQRRGKIINLAGGGATTARPDFSAYAASKAAVVRLTETLAEEVKPYNIQVNAIAPGLVLTRMWDEMVVAREAEGGEAVKEVQRQVSDSILPEIPAALAVFLASDQSNRLTGKLISATHDEWQTLLPEQMDALVSSPAYSLRRIDTYTLQQINPQWRID